MFRSYLIIALGNIVRHRLCSLINIAGLTVGLTCAIFVILIVRDQLSYDRWIPAVVIANAIAWPVTWYYLHDWLQGFAYRITLSPLYFLGASAVALAVAWATVFVHAHRVA